VPICGAQKQAPLAHLPDEGSGDGGEVTDRVNPVLNPSQPMPCAASSDEGFMVESELGAALGTAAYEELIVR
jgi:hypothetical protein